MDTLTYAYSILSCLCLRALLCIGSNSILKIQYLITMGCDTTISYLSPESYILVF